VPDTVCRMTIPTPNGRPSCAHMDANRLPTLLEDMTHDKSSGDAYPERLVSISLEIPHTIHVVSASDNDPLGEFNCVMHALGLVGRFTDSCMGSGRWCADTRFLEYLI
jgi:hypothetical protein